MSQGPSAGTDMRWAAALSKQPDTQRAAVDAAVEIADALEGETADLLLAFFTAEHIARAEVVRATLTARLSPSCLAGAGGGGVVGPREEVESGPGLALVAARLPGVRISPFLLPGPGWFDPLDDPLEFARHAPGAEAAALAVLLADPFTLDLSRVLSAFRRHAPKLRITGGMVSAATAPGGNVLFLNDWLGHEGGIAVALAGALRADFVVSPGCQPVGPPLVVTRCQQNVLLELDGEPAGRRVEQVLQELPEPERELLRRGVMIGRPVKRDARARGDYLIRNLLGHDPKTGALAVGDLMREGERLRLHARDARTAREDLELLLAPQAFDTRAEGFLLFNCNGRGQNLYPEANADVDILQAALGGVPGGGLFCAGEIGPLGGRNHLHGHTASAVIVRSESAISPEVG